MPIDPNILLSLQPPKPVDILGPYQTMAALKTQQLQQQDIASQIQQRNEEAQQKQIANQKAVQAAQTISDHLKGGGSLDDDELVSKLAAVDPQIAMNLRTNQAATKKTQAETNKANAETAAAGMKPEGQGLWDVIHGTFTQRPLTQTEQTDVDLKKAQARKETADAIKTELETGNNPQSFDEAQNRLNAIAPADDKDLGGVNTRFTGLLKAGAQNPAGWASTLKDALSQADKVASARATAPIKIDQAIQTAQGQAAGATGSGLDLMAEQALNGQFSSRNPQLMAKVYQRASDLAKERGLTATGVVMGQNAAKANKAALDTLTQRAAMIKTFTDTTNAHANTLEQAMQNVTDLGAPVLNTPIRDLQNQFGGNPKVTAFQTALAPVQNELAKALNGSLGSSGLTDTARAEFQPILNGGATANQLKAALAVLKEDMAQQNKVYEANKADLLGQTVVGGGGSGAPAPAFVKPGGALEKLLSQ